MSKDNYKCSVKVNYSPSFPIDKGLQLKSDLKVKMYAFQVEHRLKEWGGWLNKFLENGLGYPSQSTLVTALQGSKSTVTFYPADNLHAEQVHMAFLELRNRHPVWASIIEAEYVYTKLEKDESFDKGLKENQTIKAVKLGMTRSNYKIILKAAKGFIEGRVS